MGIQNLHARHELHQVCIQHAVHHIIHIHTTVSDNKQHKDRLLPIVIASVSCRVLALEPEVGSFNLTIDRCFIELSRHPLLITDVKNKWESSSWGRKLIVQKKRAALTDFDRFKVMLAKIKVRMAPVTYYDVIKLRYSEYPVCFPIYFLILCRELAWSGGNSQSCERRVARKKFPFQFWAYLIRPFLDHRESIRIVCFVFCSVCSLDWVLGSRNDGSFLFVSILYFHYAFNSETFFFLY